MPDTCSFIPTAFSFPLDDKPLPEFLHTVTPPIIYSSNQLPLHLPMHPPSHNIPPSYPPYPYHPAYYHPFPMHPPFLYNFLPRQSQFPAPPVHSLSSSLDTVPTIGSLTHIPILTGKSDWVPWSDRVGTTLLSHDLISHICEMLDPLAPFDICYVPSHPPPHHDVHSLTEELAAYCLWCHRDGAALSVLFGHLSPAVCLLLPNTGAHVYYCTNHLQHSSSSLQWRGLVIHSGSQEVTALHYMCSFVCSGVCYVLAFGC